MRYNKSSILIIKLLIIKYFSVLCASQADFDFFYFVQQASSLYILYIIYIMTRIIFLSFSFLIILVIRILLLVLNISDLFGHLIVIRLITYMHAYTQWPGAYCDTKHHSCCYPKTGKPTAEFSIHGLWPNHKDGSWPSNCNPDSVFDRSEVSMSVRTLDYL